jgi:hypothetical protein
MIYTIPTVQNPTGDDHARGRGAPNCCASRSNTACRCSRTTATPT